MRVLGPYIELAWFNVAVVRIVFAIRVRVVTMLDIRRDGSDRPGPSQATTVSSPTWRGLIFLGRIPRADQPQEGARVDH
jgi:hypothetical protein